MLLITTTTTSSKQEGAYPVHTSLIHPNLNQQFHYFLSHHFQGRILMHFLHDAMQDIFAHLNNIQQTHTLTITTTINQSNQHNTYCIDKIQISHRF